MKIGSNFATSHESSPPDEPLKLPWKEIMMTDTKQNMRVEEATEALADAITSDERFVVWQQVNSAMEQDAEMAGLMQQYQSLAARAKDSRHGGPVISEEDIRQLESVKKAIESNELFTRHHETTGAVLEMLKEVNQALSARVGLDFAAATAQKGPGCRG
jgi:cell fate (sporulation/competence/biofilm development) regulator YlbF (YheA/YmcA/DUF963 family)